MSPIISQLLKKTAAKQRHSIRPSRFVESFFQIPHGSELQPFSIADQRYFYRVYDTPAQKTLLMCGRQVGKTVEVVSTYVLLASGRRVRIDEVKVGDRILGLDQTVQDTTLAPGIVTWKSEVYTKPAVTITTRQGHCLTAGLEHPLRKFSQWVPAANIEVGDRVAAVRRAGEFQNVPYPAARVLLLGYMLGDGCLLRHSFNFTALPGVGLSEFLGLLRTLGDGFKVYPKQKTLALNVRIREGVLGRWLEEDGLRDCRSEDKFVPPWVYTLSEEDTALFLNRLWSTDGHVGVTKADKHTVEYYSTSYRLAQDIQALLWKFGIPTALRAKVPKYHQRKGKRKLAYTLRVETRAGVLRFLAHIGALGKSEEIGFPPENQNNNRDTLPKEINTLIQRVLAANPNRPKRTQNGAKPGAPQTLRNAGLRSTLRHPPTGSKIRKFVDYFRRNPGYDPELVSSLAAHLRSDIYWDQVVSVEEKSQCQCMDLTVEGTDSFVANGLVTHNSTSIGNLVLASAILRKFFKIMYVAPRQSQTADFSKDRIKQPLEWSIGLDQFQLNRGAKDNTFYKEFLSGSNLRLLSAYLSADALRGKSADMVAVDELQDILSLNLPVIEECMFRSMFKIFKYSGTPKTETNTMAQYWRKFSTQNEWLIPCDRCGGGDFRFWNLPGEENIGAAGLVCAKCGGDINPAHPSAQWVSMNPNPGLEIPFEGFRVPQIITPTVHWPDLLDKKAKYPRFQFMNEVLALPYDVGTKPITQAELQAICIPTLSFHSDTFTHGPTWLEEHCLTNPVYMGIDWGCHDEETRILTEDGFKHFRDLRDDDRVAQFDPDTRELGFVIPKVRTVRDWDGELLHFKTRSMDQLVTPTHRMLHRTQTGPWKTSDAATVAAKGSNQVFVGALTWAGQERPTFTLPGVPRSAGYPGSLDKSIPMDVWLEFLGYYLSEGGLCWKRRPGREPRPVCVKMSQRAPRNAEAARLIKKRITSLGLRVTEFPNTRTGDRNWTIYGKQIWEWVRTSVGPTGDTKRIPREFFELAPRQLRILFDALILGDGSRDRRPNATNGAYYSTSKGLCEDVQELCLRLGYRASVALHKPAEGNRKTRWRTSFSAGKDYQLNQPKARVSRVPYSGKVYCCSVPTGYIVTERKGKLGFQGNTGENSYTVITLCTYLRGHLTFVYYHRCIGEETEPKKQLALIEELVTRYKVKLIGADYGGGFDRNDALVRMYGQNRILKYQYPGAQMKGYIRFEPTLGRYLVHRSELMSCLFNAMRNGMIRLPRWEELEDPYAEDMLNIYADWSEAHRMVLFDKPATETDDSFHSTLYGMLASMIEQPRHDILHGGYAFTKSVGENRKPLDWPPS